MTSIFQYLKLKKEIKKLKEEKKELEDLIFLQVKKCPVNIYFNATHILKNNDKEVILKLKAVKKKISYEAEATIRNNAYAIYNYLRFIIDTQTGENYRLYVDFITKAFLILEFTPEDVARMELEYIKNCY